MSMDPVRKAKAREYAKVYQRNRRAKVKLRKRQVYLNQLMDSESDNEIVFDEKIVLANPTTCTTHVMENISSPSTANSEDAPVESWLHEESEVRTKRKRQEDITSQPPKKTRDGEHQWCLINWVHSKISKQKFMFPDSRFSGQLVLEYV